MELDITYITTLIVPIILVACLIVGYVIKVTPLFADVANEYIPVIVTCLGVALSIVYSLCNSTPITLESVVAGALTGLASTGLHQAFKQIINKNTEA